MASKLIAQLIVMGTQIVGRAFMDAYRQAAANAGKAGAARASQAASGATSGGSTAINEFTRKTGLSLEESLNILNVDKNVALEELERKYQHLMKVNDQKTGGSFYLQSKVHRAKERIEMELLSEKTKESPQPPTSPNTSNSSNNRPTE